MRQIVHETEVTPVSMVTRRDSGLIKLAGEPKCNGVDSSVLQMSTGPVLIRYSY
jgi:hypothetical protein